MALKGKATLVRSPLGKNRSPSCAAENLPRVMTSGVTGGAALLSSCASERTELSAGKPSQVPGQHQLPNISYRLLAASYLWYYSFILLWSLGAFGSQGGAPGSPEVQR